MSLAMVSDGTIGSAAVVVWVLVSLFAPTKNRGRAADLEGWKLRSMPNQENISTAEEAIVADRAVTWSHAGARSGTATSK